MVVRPFPCRQPSGGESGPVRGFCAMRPLALQWRVYSWSLRTFFSVCARHCVSHRLLQFATFYAWLARLRDLSLRTRDGVRSVPHRRRRRRDCSWWVALSFNPRSLLGSPGGNGRDWLGARLAPGGCTIYSSSCLRNLRERSRASNWIAHASVF